MRDRVVDDSATASAAVQTRISFRASSMVSIDRGSEPNMIGSTKHMIVTGLQKTRVRCGLDDQMNDTHCTTTKMVAASRTVDVAQLDPGRFRPRC